MARADETPITMPKPVNGPEEDRPTDESETGGEAGEDESAEAYAADREEPAMHKAADCEEPNRSRRTYFVFVSVGVAFVADMYLALGGYSGKIPELVADGLITYMLTACVAYLTAHSLDRSKILDNWRKKR